MMIDVHAHYDQKEQFYHGLTMPQTDISWLKAMMAAADIKGVLFFAGLAAILEAPKTESGLFEANECLAETCRSAPDMFAYYLMIHSSRASESIEVIRRFHADRSVVGVGEILPAGHFNGHEFNTDTMMQIAQCAAEHRLPMNFHTGTVENVRQLEWLVERVPEGTYILAHAAGEAVNEGLNLMDKYPNVWMDLSVHAWKAGVREPLVERADKSRLLFGSDFPIESPSVAVEHFGQIGFSPDEMLAISNSNAFNLFPTLRDVF